MRRSIWITLAVASLGLDAQADDGMESTLKSRAIASVAASTSPAKAALSQAPFTQARDPLPEMTLREEQERRLFRGTCQNAAKDLCYDLADGRIVYRPVRQYMPKVEGLRAESVSLRHDRIILKYSFR
jgi:hypothetical protein